VSFAVEYMAFPGITRAGKNLEWPVDIPPRVVNRSSGDTEAVIRKDNVCNIGCIGSVNSMVSEIRVVCGRYQTHGGVSHPQILAGCQCAGGRSTSPSISGYLPDDGTLRRQNSQRRGM